MNLPIQTIFMTMSMAQHHQTYLVLLQLFLPRAQVRGNLYVILSQMNTSHCAPYFRNNWMIFQNKILNGEIFVLLFLACNVLYLNSVDTESLTGPQAVAKAIKQTFDGSQKPKQTVVHFKVSNQGITLTDNQRK